MVGGSAETLLDNIHFHYCRSRMEAVHVKTVDFLLKTYFWHGLIVEM